MCKIEIKQNTTKSLYDKRELFLREEVNKKILIALKQFAKENDYSGIVDISKEVFVWDGLSIAINDSLDITKEFIQFYNERFAGKKLQ